MTLPTGRVDWFDNQRVQRDVEISVSKQGRRGFSPSTYTQRRKYLQDMEEIPSIWGKISMTECLSVPVH